jgi:Fe-S cluster assembly protein SufD
LADLATHQSGALPQANIDDLAVLSGRLGDSGALARARAEALHSYRRMTLPDRVQHLWRYTDPARLLPDPVILSASLRGKLPPPLAVVPEIPTHGASGLIQTGTVETLLLSPEMREAGVQLRPLGSEPGALDLLGGAVPATHGPFAALNAATWSAGAVLRIPRGVRLDRPIHLALPAAAAISIPRVLVVVEPGAEATVVEEHLGGEPGHRVNGVSELFIGQGARLSHVLLQRWAAGVSGHLTQRAVVHRDGRIDTLVTSFGGATMKADIGSELVGEGAHSEILGLAVGEGRQHLDHHTVHAHRARHTTSNLDLRVAVAGRANSAYTGLIRIDERASGCEAYQQNRNLLLSGRAQAKSIPELEILNHDVSCSHGATVAPMDEEPLFYLQSRGVNRDEAMRIAVRGFLDPVLQQVPHGLREDVTRTLENRIAALERGKR